MLRFIIQKPRVHVCVHYLKPNEYGKLQDGVESAGSTWQYMKNADIKS